MRKVFLPLVLLACVLTGGESRAEFVKSGALTWGTDQFKIIKSLAPAGFFVVYTPAGRSLQNFDLSQLDPAEARSLFIVFDRTKNSFSKVVTPGGDEYAVSGSATVQFSEKDRFGIDADPSNPYISFESEGGILGFAGENLVFNLKGSDVAAKFVANRLQAELYKDKLKPYQVNEQNAIVLDGQKVLSRIGVTIEMDNPCLKPDTLVVEDPAAAIAAKNGGSLDNFVKELQKKHAPTIESFMKLTTSKGLAVVFSPFDGKFSEVKPIDGLPQICQSFALNAAED